MKELIFKVSNNALVNKYLNEIRAMPFNQDVTTILEKFLDWIVDEGWIPTSINPAIGDEYNVIWELEDGRPPVVTTMEWVIPIGKRETWQEGQKEKWVDTRGAGIECKTVLYWKSLPSIPKWVVDEWRRQQERRCDICGEPFTGKSHAVIDENYNTQEGLIQCTSCYETNLNENL